MEQAASARAGEAGRWHAVVVGINHYSSANQLEGAVNDALAVRELLQRQLSVPASNVRLLLAPGDGHDTDPAALAADAATLRAAFADVQRVAREGDHVVLYYAGHGVRVTVAKEEERALWVFGLAASDFAWSALDRMIDSLEIVDFLEGLAKGAVRVTAFFDCCHSGGAIRDPDGKQRVRGIAADVAPDAWNALQRTNGAAAAATTSGGAIGSGWVRAGSEGGEGDRADWVVMSACCAEQVAAEGYDDDDAHHGFFTMALLRALKDVSPAQAGELRWRDLHARVRAAMPVRLAGDQRPTVEGITESLVFGGHFQPFDPGFTVTNDPPEALPSLSIDGGRMQGLDKGAVVRIYPPGTADFEAAVASTVATVDVTIDSAEPAKSRALLPADRKVPDGSRARLVEHSPLTPPVDVRLAGLPDEIGLAAASLVEVAAVHVVPANAGQFDVEVVRWEGAIPAWEPFTKHPRPAWVGTPGGWALIPFSATRTQVTPDDVIAYVPPVDASRDAASVGRALGRGLVHWARYLDVKRRTHSDPCLAQYLQVRLCTGPDKAAPDATYSPMSPNAAGNYVVSPRDHLWVELTAKQGLPGGIFAGVLACSDDGNLALVWPLNDDSRVGLADASENLSAQEIKRVGAGPNRSLGAPVRQDQQSSAYTLKVVAYATTGGGDPVNLESLVQRDTVQDVIAQALAAGARGEGESRILVGPVWATWDLPIRSRK